METGKIIGGMIGLTIIGIGAVWIYRNVKEEERREIIFQNMLTSRRVNDPETRAGGVRGIQNTNGVKATDSIQDTGAV